MSGYVDTLNRWGEKFFGFAGPMLWQSSLLIAVVFVFDWVFARRIRASIRYALWMVVLVKLLLPPTLALPTGVTWWLWRVHPAVEPPLIKNYTVSFDNTLPEISPPTVPIVLPPPKLSTDAWFLLAATVTAVVFLSYLTFRWLRVAGKVRRTATAPAELSSLLDEARQLAGLRRSPRLKLIDDAQSPAVYGLFRPVILLPRTLANQLSVRQLRAVLLHEAVHLRRGDVWVNCAQTFLQIAYWWHPLLWLANARIRRLREEAVDDAVMLALRDGADAYAPTLLEVAKYAFRRPLASLGLVGILESRSALRQRVERLVDFRPPRKTGITFLSACGIFAFCVVALPMGQGPAANDSFSDDLGSSETTVTLHVNPDVFIRNIKARASWTMEPNTNNYSSILLDILENQGIDCLPPHGFSFNTTTGEIKTQNASEQLEIFRRVIEELNRPDGKWTLSLTNRPVRKLILIQGEYFWMTSDKFKKTIAGASHHRGQNGAAPDWTADPMQLEEINQRIKSMGLQPVMRPRIQTCNGITAQMYLGDGTNGFELDCDPYMYHTNIVLDLKAESMSISTQGATTVTNRYDVYSKPTVADDGGVIVRAPNPNGPSNLVVVLNVKTVSSESAIGTPALERRSFDVGTNVFFVNLRKITGSPISASDTNVSQSLKHFFEQAGVDWSPPKTLFLNTRLDGGVLFVCATPSDMDVIERIVSSLHDPRGGDSRWLKSINDRTVSDTAAGTDFKGVADNSARDAGREAIYRKLTRIHVSVSYDNQPLNEVIRDLGEQSRKLDPDKQGINFQFDPIVGLGPSSPVPINPNTGLPIPVGAAPEKVDVTRIKIHLNLNDVTLPDALNAICLASNHPIKYSIEDHQVVFFAVVSTKYPGPLLHIKARFIEVPQKFFSSAAANSLPPGMTNGGILSATEMKNGLRLLESQNGSEELAEPEVTTISGRQTQMRATRVQEVVTNYIAKPNPDNPAELAISPQTAKVETGPILDVFPLAVADDHSIGLTAIADLIQFFGYASPQGLPISYATNSAGQAVPLATSLPAFQVCEAQGVKTTIYDGQTLVLFPKPVQRSILFFPKPVPRSTYDPDKKRQEIITRFIQQAEKDDKAEYGNKVLLVLVTATLIDAAGNRIHPVDQSPFAQAGVSPRSP